MRLINKSKKGFTLVEMLLVVAIIVILAGVVSLNVTRIMDTAHHGDDAVSEGVSDLRVNIASCESKAVAYHF